MLPLAKARMICFRSKTTRKSDSSHKKTPMPSKQQTPTPTRPPIKSGCPREIVTQMTMSVNGSLRKIIEAPTLDGAC